MCRQALVLIFENHRLVDSDLLRRFVGVSILCLPAVPLARFHLREVFQLVRVVQVEIFPVASHRRQPDVLAQHLVQEPRESQSSRTLTRSSLHFALHRCLRYHRINILRILKRSMIDQGHLRNGEYRCRERRRHKTHTEVWEVGLKSDTTKSWNHLRRKV
jgi:hypothetical protein